MPKYAFLTLFVLFLALAPVAAQDQPDAALDWVPATFDAVVRADLRDSAQVGDFSALGGLNLAFYVASRLEPGRLRVGQPVNYNAFFPVSVLDAEKVTFEQNVLPWIDGTVVLAYRNFGAKLNVEDADFLMVLPTKDTLRAADFLSTVVQQQDFPKRETYQSASLFIGDRSTIALTPNAVLIGSPDNVKAAIDAQAGKTTRLVDTAAYQVVRAALPASDFVMAYVDGAQSLRTVSVLLAGNDSGLPMLSALGGVLKAAQVSTLEAQLLSGAVRGMGFSLSVNMLTQTVRGHVAVAADSPSAAVPFDPSVLQAIPRSAILVQSGADGRAAFDEALRLMPLSSFALPLLQSIIPLRINAAMPSPPNEAAMQSAVDGFIGTLRTVGGFDLETELAAHLNGSYALVVIPRPNNPAPVTGAPVDLLIAARVSDGDAAIQGATKLASVAFGLPPATFKTTQIDGVNFNSLVLPTTGETTFSTGVVDGLLLAGTGDAVSEAMRAHRGDNQLIKVDRWKDVTGDTPVLYADLNALYSIFLPEDGAQQPAPAIGQLGIDVQDAGGGVTLFDVRVSIPAE